MRGKASNDNRRDALYGITPAYAGKRPDLPDSKNDIEDHPRLCGEKRQTAALTLTPKGSPPPMRGKVGGTFGKGRGDGITPAYAGKRSWRSCENHRPEDHPRLCGEKWKKG